EGSNSIILAVGLLIVTGILIFLAIRLHHPIEVKRPGKFPGISLVVLWVLSVATFLVAVIIYVLALYRQLGHITGPADPITPVTELSGLVAFFVIVYLARHNGFWVAVGSAIVGTIAAPMIFELPFDLIVMWRTFPPTPTVLFTLLFFLPLFLVEILSFALLTLSPIMKLSRYTLFLLAGMFLIFAVWALFGFAYPYAPLPVALNMISKVVAFATAISLFIPPGKIVWSTSTITSTGHEIM
ncbi:MAG TPA: hypothetical protein VKU38_18865, partial [Ktedonobacteraceae bacterium]|nr:hypothetical protein [Ktedonobacteraceae bacterium]